MLECHALSDRGCCRRNNEDYCRIEPELGLYVLADGMGGARAGETAARLAVDTVVESVLSAGGRRDSQVLLSAVEEAHRRVIQAAGADPDLRGMGTTLLVVLETGQELVIASVGDSRAYLFEPGSGLSAITEDQTWVNEVGRPLGMDEESLRNHPMRHVLTMAIGAGASLTIHYYAVQMRPSSLLLLSTDGLHGVIEAGAIEEILGGAGCNGSLRQKCEQLIQAAKDAGGPDNVTAVLLRAPAAAA